MRKLFTVEAIVMALITGLGYGYGETFGFLLGWPEPLCLLACLVVGMASESIMSKVIYSKFVQSRPSLRLWIYLAFVLLFVAANYFAMERLGVSMSDYVIEQFFWVMGLPIIGFFINLVIGAVRTQLVRRRYGDGSEGYQVNLSEEDLDELSKRNQRIVGDYDAGCAVKTRTGIYVGQRELTLTYYCGIPYAQPPVGDLRWKAPQPLPDSDDVFEAKHFGPSAIQVERQDAISKLRQQSEDCLTLNVGVMHELFKPGRGDEQKKPVLVLFHHGDFTYGGSADPLALTGNLMKRYPDFVFVSINYRLGIFGFIDFGEVPGGDAYPDAANLGLLDQIAALRWIQENIAAFGGDPDQVTVMGLESGATSISLLAASEQARGLFRRAFVFNGVVEAAYDTPEGARTLARRLLEETHAQTMDELAALDTDTLKDAAQRLWQVTCGPTCDGALIPANVNLAYREGAARDVEFVIGIPGNELSAIRSYVGDDNYQEFVTLAVSELKEGLGESVVEELEAYIAQQEASLSELEAKTKLLNLWVALCLYRSAEALAASGASVRLLYWNETPLVEKLGSGTVDVLATFLGNDGAAQMYGSVVNGNLAEELQCLLHKYVRGEALALYPNELYGVDAFEWEVFPQVLVVDGERLRQADLRAFVAPPQKTGVLDALSLPLPLDALPLPLPFNRRK